MHVCGLNCFVLLTQIANAVQSMPYPRIQVEDEPEERANRYLTPLQG